VKIFSILHENPIDLIDIKKGYEETFAETYTTSEPRWRIQ